MSRPTTRVLAVLELLQSHGHLSGGEIASRLEVDRRTVRRYIAQLEEMGIPITASHGPEGGYSLVAGFKLPPLMFTSDEAVALAIGLLAARSLGLAEAAPAVAGAQAKLERVMPAPLKERVRALDATVELDLSAPTAPGNNAAMVTLSAAAQDQQRVHLCYRDPRGSTTERDFDPYGLAYYRGRWYAVGFCHLREDLRSFRLDRIRSVERYAERPTRFERPSGFALLEYLTKAMAHLPRAFAFEILLETDLATARAALFPTAGLLTWQAPHVLLQGQTDDVDWFAQELARLPFAFTIRQPTALREALVRHAQKLLDLAHKG